MDPSSCPPLYYPATVVLVDDDLDFVNSLAITLDPHLIVKTFDSPTIALEFLQEKAIQQESPSAFIETPDAIVRKVFDANRAHTISTVIIDYDMPGMDGLELCRQLEGTFLRKILLTGKADENTAIDAFNAGLIDRFVPKSHPEMTARVSQYIAETGNEFFNDLVREVLWPISRTIERPYLEDPAFNRYFDQYRSQNQISEFYLSLEPSGFLVLNEEGESKLLLVQTVDDLRVHLEVAENENAPEELQKLLSQHTLTPQFPTADGYFSREIGDWQQYLYPTERIRGCCDYFVATVPVPDTMGVSEHTVSKIQQCRR